MQLPECGFLGPNGTPCGKQSEPLPNDYLSNPLAYLPPVYVLTPQEVELASQYERGDFSGGYREGQIAHFRRGTTTEVHKQRRDRFRRLLPQLQNLGIELPASLVELTQNDNLASRLRHNTIWLDVPEELVPHPDDESYVLYGLMWEGQGCGNWQLLFAPDRTYVVWFSDYGFGFPSAYPKGIGPPLPNPLLYKCCSSFEEFVVRYSREIVAQEENWSQ